MATVISCATATPAFSIVDIDSGAAVGTLQGAANATGWVSNLDGSRIATLGGRGNISLFREEESPTANGPMPVMTDNALRLSADGRTLAVGGRGGELYVARLDGDAGEAGYRLRRLRLPAPALQYEISPDGASIVTAEADGTVTISDLTFGSSASGAPANQVQTAGAEPESTPVPAPPVTVAETIEISGHGAPLTAMALSPDGERLATASLDGRLRITSIAWARLVHRLPFAALPSGPERAKLEPQPLDESPYVLMGQTVTSGRFDDNEPFEQPFIIVYNARKSLGQALGARDRAAEAGFPGGAHPIAAKASSAAFLPSRRRRRATLPCQAFRRSSAEPIAAISDHGARTPCRTKISSTVRPSWPERSRRRRWPTERPRLSSARRPASRWCRWQAAYRRRRGEPGSRPGPFPTRCWAPRARARRRRLCRPASPGW